MSAVSQPVQALYSLEDYFALELASDKRHEYWQGQIVCMSGGSVAHAKIIVNIIKTLAVRLGEGDCRPLTSDLAVRNPPADQPGQPPYVYPDVSVFCGAPRLEKVRGIDTLVNPTLVVDVLSATTAARDLADKPAIYQAIAGLRHYLGVDSESPRILHWRRRAEGEAWQEELCLDPAGVIRLEAVRASLAWREVYDGVF